MVVAKEAAKRCLTADSLATECSRCLKNMSEVGCPQDARACVAQLGQDGTIECMLAAKRCVEQIQSMPQHELTDDFRKLCELVDRFDKCLQEVLPSALIMLSNALSLDKGNLLEDVRKEISASRPIKGVWQLGRSWGVAWQQSVRWLHPYACGSAEDFTPCAVRTLNP